jgi:hypothetical protein
VNHSDALESLFIEDSSETALVSSFHFIQGPDCFAGDHTLESLLNACGSYKERRDLSLPKVLVRSGI